MSDQRRLQLSGALLVACVVFGVIAAIGGVWWTVAAMVMVALSQALNVRALRRSRDG